MSENNKLIVEEIDLGIEIEKLRDHFINHVQHLPKVEQSAGFGGWSVLSRNGSFLDGWQMGHEAYVSDGEGDVSVDSDAREKIDFNSDREFWRASEICFGYLAEVIEKINSHGLFPRRARISCVPPQLHTSWHRDALDSDYAIRLHVPIITNEKAKFRIVGDEVHMPANGKAYIVAVNQVHRAENMGDKDRIHLIMNVYDFHGATENFRYQSQ